jgi:hypothetical protein
MVAFSSLAVLVEILMRGFEQSEEIAVLLFEDETSLVRYFSDVSWLQLLAYLAIFNKLNELNLSVQGRSITAPTAEGKRLQRNKNLNLFSNVCNEINFIISVP